MSDFTHPFLLRPWDVCVSFGEHSTSVKQCFLPLSGCMFPKGGGHLTTPNDIERGQWSTGWGQNYLPQIGYIVNGTVIGRRATVRQHGQMSS